MSMKVIRTSKELTPQEVYALTMSQGTARMKDSVSQEVEIKSFALYEEEDSKGELKEILSILTPEGEVLATISDTFKRDFFKMVDFFADNDMTVNSIEVLSGISKSDREFITCKYVS